MLMSLKLELFFVVANNRAIVLQQWNVTFVSGDACPACGGKDIYSPVLNEVDTLRLASGSRRYTYAIANCAISASVGGLHRVDHHFWCSHMRDTASSDLVL